MKKQKQLMGCLLSVIVLSSCSTTRALYDWKGYDHASFVYTKSSTEESLSNLLNIYATLTDHPKGLREVPAPGICADYGYLLIMKGEVEKGRDLIIMETKLYPESKIFLDRILKRFENR